MRVLWRYSAPGVAALCALLAACPRAAPPPPPSPTIAPPPPLVIPPGCEADLSGAWVHADDARWRYDALDDGGTLTLFVAPPPLDAGVVFRKFGHRDAGLADAGVGDAGLHATITLTRGPAGFVGDVQAVVSVAPSAQCPVRWPTTLVSCTDGLTLETVAASEVLPDCTQPPADAGPPTRHRLIRPDAGLDGG